MQTANRKYRLIQNIRKTRNDRNGKMYEGIDSLFLVALISLQLLYVLHVTEDKEFNIDLLGMTRFSKLTFFKAYFP